MFEAWRSEHPKRSLMDISHSPGDVHPVKNPGLNYPKMINDTEHQLRHNLRA